MARILLRNLRINADLLLVAFCPLKFYHSGHLGEEGVVRAYAHVEAGSEFGASLSDEHFAGFDVLAAVAFHAKALAMTVSSVS